MLESNVTTKPVFGSEQKELIQTKRSMVRRQRKLDPSKYGIKTKKNKTQNQGQHKNWFHNDNLTAVDSFFCSFCQSQYCSLNLI